MVERFGYSLDVGKSLESEEKSKDKKQAVSEKEESKDQSSEQKEPVVEEEPLEIPTGEDLSADSVQKDILDDIKEDIAVVSDDIDKPESQEKADYDDEPNVETASDEVYKEDVASEEVSADKIAPIIDEESAQDEDVIDKKEELDEFEEPMPDKPEPEPEPEPEKPPVPGEEDVKEMVDESFKEQNAAQETSTAKETTIDSEKDSKGFNWWKWGAGIVIILILAVIVYKLGFVGVVDNTPAVVLSDDDIDKELEVFFEDSGLVEDISEEVEALEKDILILEESEEIKQEPVITSEESVVEEITLPEKSPDDLLGILKQGLE